MADDSSTNNNTEVFIYTEGAVVPQDVVRVRVHPSVTIIPEKAFLKRHKLEAVELCEGLLEIYNRAFSECEALKRINIPSTVTKIGEYAFERCEQLEELELYDGLLEIGQYAFNYCTALKRLSVPSTVTVIHEYVFANCGKMEELKLHEGLQAIEKYAFFMCKTLKRLTIPNTVRSIGNLAFCHSYDLLDIHLPDNIESIGKYAFSHNRCPTIRIPPSLTTIPSKNKFAVDCKSMFSLEISGNVTDIEGGSLYVCHSLRNIAFPPNAEVDEYAFRQCTNLQQLFGGADTDQQLISSLKHRFDNLPLHKMIYYQSYNNITSEQLNNTTDIRISRRRSKLNPTGSQQDCLGMTPLHIMACSTVQNLELYRVLITKYPESLIIEDRWGAIPLLYAIWGDAPSEIIQLLVDSYKSIYPNHEFEWTEMTATLNKANAPLDVIRNLLDIHERSFSDQSIDWDIVLEKVALSGFTLSYEEEAAQKRLRCLVKYSMTKRIRAIGLRQYRDYMSNRIEGEITMGQKHNWLDGVKSNLGDYEKKYRELKEATAMVELALWKR